MGEAPEVTVEGSVDRVREAAATAPAEMGRAVEGTPEMEVGTMVVVVAKVVKEAVVAAEGVEARVSEEAAAVKMEVVDSVEQEGLAMVVVARLAVAVVGAAKREGLMVAQEAVETVVILVAALTAMVRLEEVRMAEVAMVDARAVAAVAAGNP